MDRGQHALALTLLADAGEKLAHLGDDALGVFGEQQVIGAGELDITRADDGLGEAR